MIFSCRSQSRETWIQLPAQSPQLRWGTEGVLGATSPPVPGYQSRGAEQLGQGWCAQRKGSGSSGKKVYLGANLVGMLLGRGECECRGRAVLLPRAPSLTLLFPLCPLPPAEAPRAGRDGDCTEHRTRSGAHSHPPTPLNSRLEMPSAVEQPRGIKKSGKSFTWERCRRSAALQQVGAPITVCRSSSCASGGRQLPPSSLPTNIQAAR